MEECLSDLVLCSHGLSQQHAGAFGGIPACGKERITYNCPTPRADKTKVDVQKTMKILTVIMEG